MHYDMEFHEDIQLPNNDCFIYENEDIVKKYSFNDSSFLTLDATGDFDCMLNSSLIINVDSANNQTVLDGEKFICLESTSNQQEQKNSSRESSHFDEDVLIISNEEEYSLLNDDSFELNKTIQNLDETDLKNLTNKIEQEIATEIANKKNKNLNCKQTACKKNPPTLKYSKENFILENNKLEFKDNEKKKNPIGDKTSEFAPNKGQNIFVFKGDSVVPNIYVQLSSSENNKQNIKKQEKGNIESRQGGKQIKVQSSQINKNGIQEEHGVKKREFPDDADVATVLKKPRTNEEINSSTQVFSIPEAVQGNVRAFVKAKEQDDNANPLWTIYKDARSPFETIQRQWNFKTKNLHHDLTRRVVNEPHKHFSQFTICENDTFQNIPFSSVYDNKIQQLTVTRDRISKELQNIMPNTKKWNFVCNRLNKIDVDIKHCREGKKELDYLNSYYNYVHGDIKISQNTFREIMIEQKKIEGYENFYGHAE